MNAKICDRCGAMWVDKDDCKVDISTVILTRGYSHSDKIGEYDLCDSCEKGLFNYLMNPNKCINEKSKKDEF